MNKVIFIINTITILRNTKMANFYVVLIVSGEGKDSRSRLRLYHVTRLNSSETQFLKVKDASVHVCP